MFKKQEEVQRESERKMNQGYCQMITFSGK